MLTREQQRSALADKLCRLPYSTLMQWGISRVARIDGLDVIGLPVWIAIRPPGEVITISSGKGLEAKAAQAGAILEGAELWAAETPERFTRWMRCSHEIASSSFEHIISFDLLQLTRHAPITPSTLIAWDEAEDWLRDRTILVPSDMIWLKPRIKEPFQYFQSSTNGLASGVNLQDAMLSGMYELIERDAWAISEYVQDNTGQWDECISLEGLLPNSIQQCVELLRKAGVRIFLFDITSDLGIPAFRCALLDNNPLFPGNFGGFGCSLDPETAARRAITEACQGRAVYISGGRDDMMRRRFLLLKNIRMDTLLGMYEALPKARSFSDYSPVTFTSIEGEWDALLSSLKTSGISEIYTKTISYDTVPIVKMICPQMDCPLWEDGTPGKRSIAALQRYAR